MNQIRWVLSICLSCAFVSPSVAEDFDIASLQKEIYSTIESVRPAVVSLGRGSFSGVIVSKEGHILSAAHAVRPGGRYPVLLPDGRRFTAIGKGSNPQVDCALLKLTKKVDDLPFVQMGESASLVINQPCLSLSFPGGQGTRGVPTVRFGRIVRSNSRSSRGMLQSSALMEPGDSGGPLFDMDGRVIGIHSRIGREMSRNYEVPVDSFKKYWNELNVERTFTRGGPPVPKLGFRGRELADELGIQVNEIVKGGLAEKHGFKMEDVIQEIDSSKTVRITQVRSALLAALGKDTKEIVVKVKREDKIVDLKVPFEFENKGPANVPLPKYDDDEFRKPAAIEELSSLPKQFQELESRLDDACIEIESDFGESDDAVILGTLIKGTKFVVSKSSMVGTDPTAKLGDSELKLKVVARDSQNDLVLLKAPKKHSSGIEISKHVDKIPSPGRFLITPDSDGAGLVSIVSTQAFKSEKQQSRGFLGVVPADYKDNQGAVLNEVTDDGAAKRAGLKVGDVVTKLNETTIKTHMDMRRFLGTVDPKASVVATIARGDEELEKTILLGAFPSSSNHAADKMDKSGRRDGFSRVIPHDADLKPSQCGGPIFDLNGKFVGLNIARNSRVRSYAIPYEVVQSLLEKQ